MVSLSAGVESVALSCFSKKETYPELINCANSHLDEKGDMNEDRHVLDDRTSEKNEHQVRSSSHRPGK